MDTGAPGAAGLIIILHMENCMNHSIVREIAGRMMYNQYQYEEEVSVYGKEV